MATPAISFNPLLTTTFLGGFTTQSEGLVQGVAMDDPAVRFALAGGPLALSETIPMFGGVGISLRVPTTNIPLGPTVARALSMATLMGFSVFNQAHAWMQTPQSPVPTAAGGMTIPFFPLKSGARIAVACDPGLISLEGGFENAAVGWDFTNQRLTTAAPVYPANVITAATWAATTGGQVTFTTTTAHTIPVGADFTISGMTPAGYNGDYTAIAGTAGSTLVAAQTVNPGASTVQGTLVAGGGSLICNVLRIQPSNCKTVIWDPIGNTASWNQNGACALIQI